MKTKKYFLKDECWNEISLSGKLVENDSHIFIYGVKPHMEQNKTHLYCMISKDRYNLWWLLKDFPFSPLKVSAKVVVMWVEVALFTFSSIFKIYHMLKPILTTVLCVNEICWALQTSFTQFHIPEVNSEGFFFLLIKQSGGIFHVFWKKISLVLQVVILWNRTKSCLIPR